MSSLDLDIDTQLIHLESEWRQAYEASIGAGRISSHGQGPDGAGYHD